MFVATCRFTVRGLNHEEIYQFTTCVSSVPAVCRKAAEQGLLDLNATVSSYVDNMFLAAPSVASMQALTNKTLVQVLGPNATNVTVWHLVQLSVYAHKTFGVVFACQGMEKFQKRAHTAIQVTMQSGIPDFDVPSLDEVCNDMT
eukprot:5565847-Amphidinium_carterae.2